VQKYLMKNFKLILLTIRLEIWPYKVDSQK